MNFFEKVYAVVRSVPRGQVISYGQVAFLAGNPRMARQVGWALHSNPRPGEIPCHRVVFNDGCLSSGFAFGGQQVQADLLRGEGVQVSDDFRVDMATYRWDMSAPSDAV